MKKNFALFAFLLIALCGKAQTKDIAYYTAKAPFKMPVVPLPQFGDKTFSIKDYGAVGDGKTLNTDAFAKAIEACSKAGGGKVVVPAGKIALGKLAQAMMYGARLLVIEGNFDQALTTVCELSDRFPVTLVNSVNPHRLEGQTTAAYEICDTLGGAPDALCLPVGNAGNISAYWMGFKRYADAGKSSTCPKMLGFQAAGAAPIVHGHPVEHPETVATAIRIGNPASWKLAMMPRKCNPCAPPPPPSVQPSQRLTASCLVNWKARALSC